MKNNLYRGREAKDEGRCVGVGLAGEVRSRESVVCSWELGLESLIGLG